MTNCPSCGRPAPSGVVVCPACGVAWPTLPDGLFRDDPLPAPAADPEATAQYRPDFLEGAGPPEAPALPPARPRRAASGATPVRSIDAAPAAVAAPAGLPAAQAALPDDLFRDEPAVDETHTSFGFRQLGAAETAAMSLPSSWAARDAVGPVAPAPAPSAWSGARPYHAPLPGTPESDLLPSERSAASGPPGRRPGWAGVVIVVLVLLLVAAGALLFWWLSTPPAGTGTVPATRAATPARSGAVTTSPSGAATSAPPAASATPPASASRPASRSSAAPSASGAAAFPPAGATSCSDTVAAGPNTSCEFAANVAAALPALSAGATQVVTAVSPVTGQSYQMTCVRADYVTCTGGTNATVYVR